ncbi:hypothetical protein [Saccharothrix longispora]|uniref:hypothetical protein n=1 Tax=Saccharothrix longispora TaxID=33920 RepID=UPI0028FCFD24|nr:hypothetical protein [Saccharothrix longispora]MBY8850783.1 hypothetical protein [Saccharothrix sp. MB29]MDU0288527.1 hypothetical protein [Saccharothrix longispora]
MTRLALAWVRAAAALLPHSRRERYSEQWRADVEGAREVGLHPLGVALGALRVARRERGPLTVPVPAIVLVLRLRESRGVGAALVVLLLVGLGGGGLLY